MNTYPVIFAQKITMVYLFELLRYLLPSLVMLALVYMLAKSLLRHLEIRNASEAKQSVHQAALPVRMQAYERLILLLERLRPSSLLIRNSGVGMTASQLQAQLLQNIRDEFEHNLSQQLYVSGAAWEKVRSAREETIKLINSIAAKLTTDATATDLAQQILIAEIDLSYNAVNLALDALKAEAADNFF